MTTLLKDNPGPWITLHVTCLSFGLQSPITMAKLKNSIIFIFCLIFGAQAQPDNLALSYDILEEQDAGALIGDIFSDSGLDSYYSPESLQEIYFRVMDHSSQYEKYFTIDGRLLRTNAVLDRDEICSNLDACDLDLDLAIQPIKYFNILKVALHIVDLNDNVPSFSPPEFQLEISEAAVPDSQFVLPVAEDADSGVFGVQGYRLLGEDSGVFQLSVVHNPGGASDVNLILKQRLDREVVDSYHLKVWYWLTNKHTQTLIRDQIYKT